MHQRILMLSGLAALLLLAVSPTFAGKGGGGGKPGGGGGDPVYTVSYQRGSEGYPYVMTEDGSTTKQLGQQHVHSTIWHADGDRLLVVSHDYSDGSGVYELDLSGKETKLFDVGSGNIYSYAVIDMSPVVSPSGQRLIVYSEHDDSVSARGLWVRNEDGSNPVEILAAESGILVWQPVFHPSGESIAVKRKAVGVPGQIWLLELDFDSSGDAFVSSMSALTGLAGTALEGVDVNFPAFTNSGDTLAVSGESPGGIWFVNTADLTDITNVIAGGDLYGEGDRPRGGSWNATDDLFYFHAWTPVGPRIHVLDSSGVITNLGSTKNGGPRLSQLYPACKKP